MQALLIFAHHNYMSMYQNQPRSIMPSSKVASCGLFCAGVRFDPADGDSVDGSVATPGVDIASTNFAYLSARSLVSRLA